MLVGRARELAGGGGGQFRAEINLHGQSVGRSAGETARKAATNKPI